MSKDQTSDAGPVLGPPAILTRAQTEAARLRQLKGWKWGFQNASLDPPLLVRRLDQTDRYYYLVSFRGPHGVTARLRMNAYTGKYSEAIAVDSKNDALGAWLTLERVRQRVTQQRAYPARAPIVIEPLLAWKPCAQSFSAFLPFYLVWVRKKLRYYRVDGKVYDQLTFGAGL